MFARLGIPQKVISDNGPQYSSQEFVTFATEYDFMHATSSPRHPQSNGLAEKTVQIAKGIFEKSKSDGRDPYLGILEYCTYHSSRHWVFSFRTTTRSPVALSTACSY